MPTQLLSIGSVVTLVQNVVYALPSRPATVTTSVACETSVNGSTWTAFTSGGTTTAKFIRCPTGSSVVSVAAAGAGGGGTPITDVLTLVGSGSPPPAVVLIDTSQAANNRRWIIKNSGGNIKINPQTDAGVDQGMTTTIGFNSQINCENLQAPAIVGLTTLQTGGGNSVLRMAPRAVATVTQAKTVGDLMNFNDSTVNTIGAVIAGGGANNVLGRWNGTNWTVIGV